MAKTAPRTDEATFMTEAELYRLEFLQERLQTLALKEKAELAAIDNKELMIRNHMLAAQALRAEIVNIRNTVSTIQAKNKAVQVDRDEFVAKLAETYGIEEPGLMGYDSDTGEVFEYKPDHTPESPESSATNLKKE